MQDVHDSYLNRANYSYGFCVNARKCVYVPHRVEQHTTPAELKKCQLKYMVGHSYCRLGSVGKGARAVGSRGVVVMFLD